MTNDKVNFSLRLNPYIHNLLTEEAKRLGVSKNSLITILLNEQLNQGVNLKVEDYNLKES